MKNKSENKLNDKDESNYPMDIPISLGLFPLFLWLLLHIELGIEKQIIFIIFSFLILVMATNADTMIIEKRNKYEKIVALIGGIQMLFVIIGFFIVLENLGWTIIFSVINFLLTGSARILIAKAKITYKQWFRKWLVIQGIIIFVIGIIALINLVINALFIVLLLICLLLELFTRLVKVFHANKAKQPS